MSSLEAKARELLRHHLDAATSEFALGLMASAPDMWAPPAGGGGRARGAKSDEGGDGLENVPPEEQEQDVGVRMAGWLGAATHAGPVGCAAASVAHARAPAPSVPADKQQTCVLIARRARCCPLAPPSGRPK